MNTTILIESNSLSSQKTQIYQQNNFVEEDTFKEKIFNHRWKTKLPKQINLQVGDRISIEKCMINSKGQSDETIEMTSQAFVDGYKDNEAQMEFGYYLNNNMEFNLTLPKIDIKNKTIKDNLQTLTEYRDVAVDHPAVIRGDWIYEKGKVVVPKKTGPNGEIIQEEVREEVYNWPTEQTGEYYINLSTGDQNKPVAFIRKYGAPMFRGSKGDYYHIVKEGTGHTARDVLETDTGTCIYKLTEHAPIHKLGYNQSTCSTNHILLNKPDSNTRFYIGKRDFEGFYDDDNFDIKRSKTTLKLPTGFNNPVVISKKLTTQLHQQVSDDFNEPFENLNYVNSYKTENVSDNCMKVQTTFAGNIFHGQKENNDKYNFKLPNQNSISAIYDKPDIFRYANRQDCENVFWNQLLVGDIKRALAISKFYGGITSINPIDLHFDDDYLSKDINVFSGLNDVPTSIKTFDEYNQDEKPFELGIQPVIFDNLASFSTTISEAERSDIRNTYFNNQLSILDKEDLLYLDNSSTKLNLQEGDCIPTNLLATQDNFNRIEQLLRNMEKPSENDLEINLNDQKFKDSLDFHLEYNRIDDSQTKHVLSAIWYKSLCNGGVISQDIYDPDINTIQKNAFPRIYNLPSPKMTLDGFSPSTSPTNYMSILGWNRMPVLLGQYMDIPTDFNLDKLRSEICSDRLRVTKIDPVSINTFSRYNPDRTPKSQNLRLPTNSFSFTDSNGDYFDDTEIKNKDLGIAVAFKNIQSTALVEETKVGSYTTDSNLKSITASETLPFGKDEGLIGAGAFNPYGKEETIYGLNFDDPALQKRVHKIQPLDFTGLNLDLLWQIDNGIKVQSTSFNSFLSDNTTDFVAIDTLDGNALSASNAIRLKITIPSSIDLNSQLGAMITHIRLYVAYDTNNNIDGTDYNLGTINMIGLPTKIIVRGDTTSNVGLYNTILPETDLKDRYLQKTTFNNLNSTFSSSNHSQNLSLPNTNLSQQLDYLKPYIELDIRNPNDYHQYLNAVELEFTENSNSKFQQRITIKRIEFMAYNTTEQREDVRNDILLHTDGYDNLKLSTTDNLKDDNLNNQYEIKHQSQTGSNGDTSVYGFDVLREKYPSNNNLEPVNITNNELSIQLRNPYETGDSVDYVIAGMGKQLNEVDSLEPVLFYGGVNNTFPTEVETIDHATTGNSNISALFSPIIAWDSANIDIRRYRSTSSHSLPHYINFSNNKMKNKKLKVQKIKIYQSAIKDGTSTTPAYYINETQYAPRVLAIFGSNSKPDINPKCAFGMNLLYCTATDYDEFLSSLTISAGTDTTSTLSGFTNNNPFYPPYYTTSSATADRIYHFTRSGRTMINDNADLLGCEFQIPTSRQAEYRYYRILLFDNDNSVKEFRIGALQIFGARRSDLGVRASMPGFLPLTTLNTRSVADYSPQLWINPIGCGDMNRDLANGYGVRRFGGTYITGQDFNSSSVPTTYDSTSRAPTQDSDGDYYFRVGANGTAPKDIIMTFLGPGANYKYDENNCLGSLNTGGSHTIIAWIDIPSGQTSSTTIYCESYYNQRRMQIKVLTDGTLHFVLYDEVGSTADDIGDFTTTTPNQFFGKYKLTIERFLGKPNSSSYYKIYKDDVLVYTNNSDYKTYYYDRASSSVLIGGRTIDNNFIPETSIADDEEFNIYGIATFNYAMPLSQSSQITKAMLAEAHSPPYREIQTSYSPIYNDAYVYDLNNLLSNDLSQPTRISLGSQTDCILLFDLQSAQTLKYLDIYPANQSTNFPETFNVNATNNSDFSSSTNIGNLYITNTYSPTNQVEYMSDEDNAVKYRINLSQTTAYRYLILSMTGIQGLTSGNKDINYVEFGGIRIIGNKTLTSGDLSVYNKFYGIHNTADNHQTGTIDKFVNGKNNFPNNCLSFKYQFSNDPSIDNEDYILENGWKFFDYDIFTKGLTFDLVVDLQDSKSLGKIIMFYQQNAQFFYPQVCDIYGSNDPNFTTETLLHAVSAISLTSGYTEYTRNNLLTALFNKSLEPYNDKGSLRYIKFKFQTPRENHLVELPNNKAGGKMGFSTGFTRYSSALHGTYTNLALLSNGFNVGDNTTASILALESSSGGFVAYEFTTEFVPTEYRLWARESSAITEYQQNPKSWEFRASSSKSAYDGGTYDVLHRVDNTEWIRTPNFTNYVPDDHKDISKGSYINTNNKYRYYVIYIVANHGSTITSLCEFAVYGKITGVSPKYKHLNWGDLRLGDMEITEYKGKQYKNLNDTDNYVEMIYTAHRSLQMNKYALYPNHINPNNFSAVNQNHFKFLKSWKFYGSNDYRALVENNDSYWSILHDRINTNPITNYDGNYTAGNISNSLLDASNNPEPITPIYYKYYKWRMYDRYEDYIPSGTLSNKSPYINLGEMRIDELDRLQGNTSDLIHQNINGNLSYPHVASRGTIKSLVNDFGDIFGTSNVVGQGKFFIHFEEEIILTSLDVWASPNEFSNPLTLILYRIDENGTEHHMGDLDFGGSVPSSFLDSDEPSKFPQYAFNIPIPSSQQIIPSYKYAIDMGNGTELTQIQFNGKRQEYNLLGSLNQNEIGATVTSTNVTTNLTNLFSNTINDKSVDAYQFSSTVDTSRTLKFDFNKEVRIQRYAFWFNDTQADYLKRWRIWATNTPTDTSDVPNDAILLDDRSDQDYNPTYSTGALGIASENLDYLTSYSFNNTTYYRFYYLEAVQFDEPASNPYISELAFYGNENYDIGNVVDNRLGQVKEGPLTDAWIIHKDKAANKADIFCELKEDIEFNKLRIWQPADEDIHIQGPKAFKIYGITADNLPYNESNPKTELFSTTNATYPEYSITSIINAHENEDKGTAFSFNSALTKYRMYMIRIITNDVALKQDYIAIAELAFYRGVQAHREDVPFICFVSKSKQDHNGALQLTPVEGEMIGPSRSFQNNKWAHIMTTKPSDLPQLATGIDGISFNNTISSLTPFGFRTLKDYNNNFNEDDPLHYSQNIMVGSENINFSFDTDEARISLKEMNTALQQGQNLSKRLRYEDYRTIPTGDDVDKKDSEANTQVVKLNPRKYSVNSSKYGSSFSYTDNNRISFHYPFNCGKLLPGDPDITVKDLFYLANQQGEGIFSSQTGVGLLNLYVGKQDGTFQKLTLDNLFEYKNTMFDKLGFKLDQLISKYGNQNAYFNRHNQDEYIDSENNALNKYTKITSPLTTNGYINGSINTSLDSAPLWNFPTGKLGLVGSQTVNSSYDPDELIATNKPSKYDYSHLLLHTDIIPKYEYVGTNQSLSIPCITSIDRTYQTGDFVFGQATNFEYVVDYPYTLSEINVDLRTSDGRPAPIDSNSTIVFRIEKQRPAPISQISQK